MDRIVEAARQFVQQMEGQRGRLAGAFPHDSYAHLRDTVTANARAPEPLSALAESALRSALIDGKAGDAVALHALLTDLRKAEVPNG